MYRLWLAIRVFFRTLFDAEIRRGVERLLEPEEIEAEERAAEAAQKKERPARPPKRSEALTLLAALQREARFVDFVKEPLGSYSDAQIGAAARDVHRHCGAVLDRLFGLEPLLDEQENASVEVPVGFDASLYRLTGNVTGEPPYRGTLAHHGWRATHCDLPEWTGSEAAALVVAPAEVELR